MTVAADLLRGRTWVALTGAGISTDSGIPDYRGPTSIRATPMQFSEFVGSAEAQRRYWARSYQGWRRIGRAEPNAGHRALVELEAHGLHGVITQNVDGLHQAAGSRDVVNLHGDIVARGLPGLRAALGPVGDAAPAGRAQSGCPAAGTPRARRTPSRRRRGGRAMARLRPGRLPGLRRPAQTGRGVLRRVRAEGSGRAGVRAGRGGRGPGRARLVADRDVGVAVRPAPGQVRAAGGDHQPRRRPAATRWPRSRSTAAARRP